MNSELTGAENGRRIKDLIYKKYIIVFYIYYLCFIIYIEFIDIIIDYSFHHSKIQEYINYIVLLNSLYIFCMQ